MKGTPSSWLAEAMSSMGQCIHAGELPTCTHCGREFVPLSLGFVSIPDERYHRLCMRCKMALLSEPVTEERLREFAGIGGLTTPEHP